ncbi:hypothetical protein [Aquibium sp. ELW1220]|uniref:hypothetical protein n=1 Tax=Aquibium sp. ELW1220 TaxID=2976766 RepID=UPI0025AFB6F9|nr:hypothetical protein [Aquibium sp. ELW1220]MDN2579187.1 hypothetical protein [Aquibium sp. ELW1220]
MRIVRKLLLGFIALFGLATVSFYILANHSLVRTSLTCEGAWKSTSEGFEVAETMFLVIYIYRPWILWVEEDGYARAETKDKPFSTFVSRVTQIGDEPLVNYLFSDTDGSMRGGYRRASKEVVLQLVDGFNFVGVCSEGI